MVGDSISLPLFLHWPQQYHPVHCRPALQHSHALGGRPIVEQVECQVQLQHRSTGSRNRLIDGQLTVEPISTPPIGVSPFRFRHTDDPAAVRYPNTPLSIAHPSLLRLEVAVGLSHWDLTPLTHLCSPLACRRQQHNYTGVCVCV